MDLCFPGVTIDVSTQGLILQSQQPLLALSSAVVGGGLTHTRCIINMHVERDYHSAAPEIDLAAFARLNALDEPYVGMMTAADVTQARWICRRQEGMTVAVVGTVGLGNLAAAGLTPPSDTGPGTINLIVLVETHLTPSALVNALSTAVEAKVGALLARRVRTREGHPATGTSTDALVVACGQRGDPERYTGPVTNVGWLIGHCVRDVLALAMGPETE